MPRAAIYARVSSKAQAESHTIESQLRVLRSFVAGQGWEIAGEYIDDGRTARTGHLEARDGFARLVHDADLDRFDLVVVLDVSRLTRTDSMEERATVLGPFQRNGIDIVTPSGGRIDLRTFLGEFYATLQALVAAEENRKRSEATLAGKARAAAENRLPGGPTPFGYTFAREDGWNIDHVAAELVRELFVRVARGESCRSIDADLAERGLTRPRGGAWSAGRTWRIVTSSAYRGEWVVSRTRRLVVATPRLVSDDLWYAAQGQLQHTGKRWLRRTKHFYLLEGLGVCEMCGSKIRVSSHAGRSPSTYVCMQRARPVPGVPKCTLPHRTTAAADAMVWTALLDAILTPGRLEKALARQQGQEAADARTWQDDLRDAKARLTRLQRAEEAILARFRRGLVSEGALDTELSAAGRERVMLERQVAAAHRAAAAHESAAAGARDLGARLSQVRETIRAATPEERQRVLRVACVGGRVTFGELEVRAMVSLPLSAELSSLRSVCSPAEYDANEANRLEFEVVARAAR